MMVAQWDASRDVKYQNCPQQEMTTHLNLCGDPERTRLLNEMADKLGGWISDNYAHPELAYWIPCYIKLHGTRRFSIFHQVLPEME